MGLDTYAVVVKENNTMELANPDLFASISGLCGGIFSANGEGSFRGKIYDNVIENATGETLYQELIPPEKVRLMSEKYDMWLATHFDGYIDEDGTHISRSELLALGEFLRICKEHGLGLHGWW